MYSIWTALTKPPVAGKSVVSISDQREYDIIPCRATSELHLYIDLTSHVFLSHAKVCLSSDGLYVMHRGLPVMLQGFACQVP